MNDPLSRKIYSVSELNAASRALLEGEFPSIWIQGEVSNFARPASGHWYFKIKDERAQIDCAMFKGDNRRVTSIPEDGTLVLVRARVSIYPRRGNFQLICQSLEPAGEGALRQAFEELKNKLAEEGLFDDAIKRALPPFPRAIAVVTSPTGAAVRDVLTTLRRRWPLTRVHIFPSRVQGAKAAPEIVKAIEAANASANCDVLIVGRGGGSLEDLWAFNEEPVARAIRASAIPVIAGVGHETDFTIADFAADLRAPTPTSAAEHAVPNRQDMAQQLDGTEAWFLRDMERRLRALRERIEWGAKRLDQLHPRTRLKERAQRLDELAQRLNRSARVILSTRGERIGRLFAELQRHAPDERLKTLKTRLAALHDRLQTAASGRVNDARTRYRMAAHSLDTVSPLATLQRGYAIVSDHDGRVLKNAKSVGHGSTIHARLAEGELTAEVRQHAPDGFNLTPSPSGSE